MVTGDADREGFSPEMTALEGVDGFYEAYSRFNSADPHGRALESWHRFELENPLTFSGMYQFWCRKH